MFLKNTERQVMGFLDGPVVRNPPTNAGDRDSIPGTGPHATDQLNPCATTTEPAL